MTNVGPLLESLRCQQEKYRELAAIAGEQKKAVAEGNADALLGMMGRKQALMTAIEDLEKGIAPARGRWHEIRRSLDEPSARAVEEAVEETRRILAELLKIEDEARAEFDRQRAKVAGELRAIVARQRARAAYGLE